MCYLDSGVLGIADTEVVFTEMAVGTAGEVAMSALERCKSSVGVVKVRGDTFKMLYFTNMLWCSLKNLNTKKYIIARRAN